MVKFYFQCTYNVEKVKSRLDSTDDFKVFLKIGVEFTTFNQHCQREIGLLLVFEP